MKYTLSDPAEIFRAAVKERFDSILANDAFAQLAARKLNIIELNAYREAEEAGHTPPPKPRATPRKP